MGSIGKFLIGILVPALLFLNTFGGIISGIWLAILGEWGIIGYGIGYLFFGVFALALIMMPGVLLAGPVALFAEKGNKPGYMFFGLLSSLYTYAILSLWCVGAIYFFLKMADSDSHIPTLIWSYAAAIGAISYMTQKEMQGGGGEGAMIASIFSQVAYIVAGCATLFFAVTLLDVIIIFGAIMLIGSIVSCIFAVAMVRESPYF